MVQLFNVARVACHRGSDAMPEPQLNLVAQNINGRIYMRAFYHPGGSGEIRKDATGQPVPPRYKFCARLQAMGAKSFRRVSTYELNRGTSAEHGLHNIVIHDDQLVEPAWRIKDHHCSDDYACRFSRYPCQHTVPVVVNVDNSISRDAAWTAKLPTDILPRAYFAGCDSAVLHLHSAANFRSFGVVRPVSAELVPWTSRNDRELWCLASLLDQIRAEAVACSSTDGHFRLRMRLDRASATDLNSSGASGRDRAADYELVSEVLLAGEELIAAGDALTLCNWITAAL
jgi:hypothetical protein